MAISCTVKWQPEDPAAGNLQASRRRNASMGAGIRFPGWEHAWPKFEQPLKVNSYCILGCRHSSPPGAHAAPTPSSILP